MGGIVIDIWEKSKFSQKGAKNAIVVQGGLNLQGYPFHKNVLIINPTFEAYPGWHDMCVSVPVMKIENKDSQ